MFEVRNLALSYGDRLVLRDVSLVVSPGEIVSLIGANGAGKTTLLKVMATLLVPDSGQVIADGNDAFAHAVKFRRQVGYLPEKIALYEDMTVKEYLVYRSRLKGEADRRRRRRIAEACELCQISETMLRTQIRCLSTGQAKRVALADALLLRPRILLLDDFLAGLDHSLRASAGELLANISSFSSVVVTGHELEDMAKWTTRFLVLDNGVIAASVPSSGMEIPALRERLGMVLEGK